DLADLVRPAARRHAHERARLGSTGREPDGHTITLGDHVVDLEMWIREGPVGTLGRALQIVLRVAGRWPGVGDEVIGEELVDRLGSTLDEDLVDEAAHDGLVLIEAHGWSSSAVGRA